MTPKSTAVPLPEARWPSAEEALSSRLFSPCRLGSAEARTRTWIPAMVPWRSNEDGEVTPEVLDWYGRFADGRPGVLVVEATGIRDVPSGPLLRIGDDRFVPGLRRLVETVHERSGGQTRLLIQVIDFLGIKRRPEKAKFLERFLQVTPEHAAGVLTTPGFEQRALESEADVRAALGELPHERLLEVLGDRAADDLERGYRERVDDEHLPHIAELPQVLPGLFADASARAAEAGFCGVELHFAHAYTMASFLSAANRRTDGYGGSVQNRARLPLEVFAAVRERVGADYPVGCRFLGDEVIEQGSGLDDAVHFGLAFAAAGMDFLSVSKGGKFEDAKRPRVGHAAYPYTGTSGHECMPTVRIDAAGPFGRNLHLSAAIRQALRAAGHTTPVVGAGGIATFELAEQALERGDCDFVGSARQSLADPDWWLKMERGAGDQVRRCIYTNYCEALDQRHVEVTCQLWDRDKEGAASLSKDGKRRLIAPPWDDA